jgi:hypothetical protein
MDWMASHVSVFNLQPKTSPSRVPLNCADPGPELRVTPPKSTPHYPNPSPRARRSHNPSPHGSVFDFQPKTSPPRVPLNCGNPGPELRVTPPQSTSHYPNPSPPAHHSRKPRPCGLVSVLLLFLVNSPYFDFSTIHRRFTFHFMYTCIYIIKVSIHNIWVLFRGVISWWN